MMLSSGHLISGLDASTATFALAMFLGGAALAVFAILVIYLIRRAGLAGIVGVLGGAGLVLVGAMLAAVLLDRQVTRDQAADRRAVELRSAELTARAIAPGSALACLDGVTSAVVESACERALFATPEAIASALAYIDARFSLLVTGSALAERDKTYRPSLERLRRSLELDRFGLVAHVLTTRGCSPTDCADLALLHDTDRVVANMKGQIFEGQVGAHALAWQPNGAGLAPTTAASPSLSSASLSPIPAGPTTAGGPLPGKFDFPSAASIPPVSIMNAEPGSPPSTEAKPAAAPAPKRTPARRQAAKPPVHAAVPPPPPAPPLNTAPPAPPQQAAPPQSPQTSGLADRPPQ
jgi:hypothetical protein